MIKDFQHWVDRWNERSIEINQTSPNDWNELMAIYCEELIVNANKAYRDGQPIMDDKDYDGLEDNLRKLKPNSYIFNKVGTFSEE